MNRSVPSARALSAALLVLGLAACSSEPTQGGGSAVGTWNTDPSGSGLRYFADAGTDAINKPSMRISQLAWGRLVQTFGLDAEGTRVPMNRDVLIGGDLTTDGTYILETNPVTSQQVLVIQRDVTDMSSGGGRDQFYALLLQAANSASYITDLPPGASGIYSFVPRNATLMVQFDDLLDPATVTPQSVRVLTGVPSTVPFEARIFGDPNFGNVSGGTFYSSRVLIDTTVSEIESFSTDPPLSVNGVGLPPSVDVNQSNVLLRLPTETSPITGQNVVLTNLVGNTVSTGTNGSVDFSSPTNDVIRAVRSGGSTFVTGDTFNGFMPDDAPPVVVGSSPGQIPVGFPPVQLPGGAVGEFVLPRLVFNSVFCSQTPSPGDVITQEGGVFAEVISFPPPVQNGVVENLQVRLLLYPEAWDEPGGAGPNTWLQSAIGPISFRSPYTPGVDTGKEPCFVQVFPQPTGFPESPGSGLFPASTLGLQFSEPMDPASLTAFDSLTLTREPAPGLNDPPLPSNAFVVGSVGQSLDLREFTFVPALPMAHVAGVEESYFLTPASGDGGPTDLAGNPLQEGLPSMELKIGATNPTVRNGGRVSRFNSPDEEPPVGDVTSGLKPEWAGQHLFDLNKRAIRPRPTTRFRGMADRTQPLASVMTPFPVGVQTPLSKFGSRMQTTYRYVDFGFTMTDTTNHNLDVEHFYWSPAAGQVVYDNYQNFEMVLAHCKFAPDEYIDPGSLFPAFQNSGLRVQYANNYLNSVDDPPAVVHPRYLGYIVNPGDLITAANGTKLMPYPLNRDLPPDERFYWTWRDSSVLNRGGNSSGGYPPVQEYTVLNIEQPGNPYYPAGHIATIGLPLLLEIRCFPDDGAIGANPFDINLAANTSSRPYFRAFSTGGVNNQGNTIERNPDTETNANGGFNPNSNPNPGNPTYGRDNTFYIGAVDFVVRTNRSCSVWFPATDPGTGSPFQNAVFSEPIMEPSLQDQPTGTTIDLDFRGATSITVSSDFDFPADCTDAPPEPEVHPALENALSLDIYGDHYWDDPSVYCEGEFPNHRSNQANKGIVFLGGDEAWRDTVGEISSAQYYQIRVTFLNNVTSGLSAELSALALSWQQ